MTPGPIARHFPFGGHQVSQSVRRLGRAVGKRNFHLRLLGRFGGSLLPRPFDRFPLVGRGAHVALAGFFLFRVFDVIKPYPARQFERLHGGLGVMADDGMAALYGIYFLLVSS